MKIPPLARALLILAAAPECVCSQVHLEVDVFNYAEAPHAVIAPAMETARQAFLAAGIHSRWLACTPERCGDEPPAELRLELYVMPRMLTPIGAGHTAGYAMATGILSPRGYAFYDSVQAVSERTLRPASVVLGCILAHEAGHLLGLLHQAHGVMRANLESVGIDEATMGRAFNADEASKLRAAVLPKLRTSVR